MVQDLKKAILNFNLADYPSEGVHIAFEDCLRTIAGGLDFEFDEEKGIFSFKNRSFEVVELYCPDLKEPDAQLWDQLAKISLKKGSVVIEYLFDNNASKISSATIYKEDENGVFEIQGIKYRVKEILSGPRNLEVSGVLLGDDEGR